METKDVVVIDALQTVGELIEALKKYPPNVKLLSCDDCSYFSPCLIEVRET